MRTSAERRYFEEKKKEKVKSYSVCFDASNPRVVGMAATTPKPCSCWMCGNPRKNLKEKSFKDKKQEAVCE